MKSNGSRLWMTVFVGVALMGSGCATLTPGTGRTWIESSHGVALKAHPVALASVTVDGFFDPAPIEEDAAFILNVLFGESNMARGVDPERAPIEVDVRVSQERVVENYLAKNAINVEIVGSIQGQPERLFRAFYATDTQSTIESYADLQRVLRRALRLVLPFSRRI